MAAPYTREQVVAMAPDSSSVKAAQKLLSPAKWPLLAGNEEAVWGHCRGSGRNPYEVQVDLAEPAFKCSCPSRKFPCKHGLALLQIRADQEAAFSLGEACPDWVREWLDSRRQRAEAKAAKAAARSETIADPEAQAKRREKRRQTIETGLDEFELWLQDVIRQGLVKAAERQMDSWSTMAARLVDCQAPGLAGYVRAMHGCLGQGADWPARFLGIAGRANLAIQAFRRWESLTPELQADLRSFCGWSLDQVEVLQSGERCPGDWQVLGQATVDRGQFEEQRTWLQATADGRFALLLSFVAGSQTQVLTLAPGSAFTGELVYYPSAAPERAILPSPPENPRPLETMRPVATVSEALGQLAEAVARCPWTKRRPVAIDAMRLARRGERWLLVDRGGASLSLHSAFQRPWHLAALAARDPVAIFGELSADGLLPLACQSPEGFFSLPFTATEHARI